jgi:hypothetical protein
MPTFRADGKILQEAGRLGRAEDPDDTPFEAGAVEGAVLVFLDELRNEVPLEVVHGDVSLQTGKRKT